MHIKNVKTKLKNPKVSVSASGQSVGIEVTPRTICMVQLNARSLNQIQLEKYLISPLPKNIFNGSSIEDFDLLVAKLQQAWQTFHTSCKNITTAIPQKLTNIQFQHLELTNEASVAESIEMELSQHGDIDALSYDYAELDTAASGKDVVLVSSNREDVDLRIDAYNAAGITPAQMDVDVIAVINAIHTWINQQHAELAEQTIAVFDLGYTDTKALILRKGRLLYKQEINLGQEQLMQLIRRNYQLTEEEAWQLLYNPEKPEDYLVKVEGAFQTQLIQEIQRVLQFYYTTISQENDADVQSILISGHGGAGSQGLAEKIQNQIHISSQQVNPVTLAQLSNQVDAQQFTQDSNVLNVAFGLAVRGL